MAKEMLPNRLINQTIQFYRRRSKLIRGLKIFFNCNWEKSKRPIENHLIQIQEFRRKFLRAKESSPL